MPNQGDRDWSTKIEHLILGNDLGIHRSIGSKFVCLNCITLATGYQKRDYFSLFAWKKEKVKTSLSSFSHCSGQLGPSSVLSLGPAADPTLQYFVYFINGVFWFVNILFKSFFCRPYNAYSSTNPVNINLVINLFILFLSCPYWHRQAKTVEHIAKFH